MSNQLTGYKVGATDLFDFHTSNPLLNTGYNVGIKDIFTYYTDLSANYQANLSKFNFIYKNNNFNNNVDIILYNYFSKSTIGTPANAIFGNINNRLCWKINGNTTFTPKFLYNTTINFVAVGGGANTPNANGVSGGRGGGVVYGTFNTLSSIPLTITIGAGGADTIITGTNTNIYALAGGGSGSTSGANIVTSTAILGGAGGAAGAIGGGDGLAGGVGFFISNLGIYIAGGGGGGGAIDSSGGTGGTGGLGGGGTGGDGFRTTVNCNGTVNTGGGAGGNGLSPGYGGVGGSGVVYFYL